MSSSLTSVHFTLLFSVIAVVYETVRILAIARRYFMFCVFFWLDTLALYCFCCCLYLVEFYEGSITFISLGIETSGV